MLTRRETGLPLAEGLDTVEDLPHTVMMAVLYNRTIESFNELPKEKRPPRYMWDRPHELAEYLEHVWDKDFESKRKDNSFKIEFEDVE